MPATESESKEKSKQSMAEQTGSVKSNKSLQEVFSFFKTLAFLLAAAIVLRASVVEAFKIPSGSMIPTLMVGDHILVSKLSYGIRLPLKITTLFQYDLPQRGDVVVFTRPDDPTTLVDESKINIIKRTVGLPGDIVEVRGSKLYINNKLLSEDYARWDRGGVPEGNFGPEQVPDDRVFLLGDNRDHSRDSRFWHDPFLPISRIKGRALFIYWSWDSLSRIGNVIR